MVWAVCGIQMISGLSLPTHLSKGWGKWGGLICFFFEALETFSSFRSRKTLEIWIWSKILSTYDKQYELTFYHFFASQLEKLKFFKFLVTETTLVQYSKYFRPFWFCLRGSKDFPKNLASSLLSLYGCLDKSWQVIK